MTTHDVSRMPQTSQMRMPERVEELEQLDRRRRRADDEPLDLVEAELRRTAAPTRVGAAASTPLASQRRP